MKRIVFFIVLFLFPGFFLSAQEHSSGPVVSKPVYFDISPPLRDLEMLPVTRADLSWKDGIVRNKFNFRRKKGQVIPFTPDPSVQTYKAASTNDTTAQNFSGISNVNGYIPPDTYGEVGPNHYFQVVNASYAVFNKTGTNISGTHNTSTVWQGMPNNTNSGDGVVLYDDQADRWVIAQLSMPYYPNSPFFIMMAVSQTNDPTGSWYRYQYQFTDLPDYPKFGVWPDGYYLSVNRFTPGSFNWDGIGAMAFNRTQMIAGNSSPQSVLFTLDSTYEASSLLPSDCDGTFPSSGTPDYFTYINVSPGPYHLGIYQFHVDWSNPANSTFGSLATLPVNSFNNFSGGAGISQQGTTVQLDPIDDRLMYRLQYRKFNTYQSMVCNHTVNMGSNQAGIRWYELRNTGSGWTVYQQSTYSPDSKSRWMASMAQDTSGNIALGFSLSSSSTYPSIRYTGRLKNDPLNTMTYAEHGIINGGGSQTSSSSRWGDYSSMTVDPAVPNTFWYTQEYYTSTSNSSWKTRIASFTLGASSTLSVTATATPSQINVGQSSQLNVIATGGTGSYVYSWTSIPAGFTSPLQNPVVSPILTTKYVATVTSGSQVKSDTCQVLVTMTVVATATPDTINPGGSSQLNATPGGGNGSYTYSWTSVPPGFTSNLQNPVVTPTQTTQYIILLSDSQQNASDTITVTILLQPLAVIASASPDSICQGGSSQLNASASGGTGNFTYSWTSVPPGFTANIKNPVASPTVSTIYNVAVNDGNSSVTGSTGVAVINPPTVAAGNDTTVCQWVNSIYLYGTANNYSAVSWSTSGDGSFDFPNQLACTYFPGQGDKSNAQVDLSLTAAPLPPCPNTISSTKHVLFDPCTGVPPGGSSLLKMSIQPNPAYDAFSIIIDGLANQAVILHISDITGKAIFSEEFTASAATYRKSLNASDFGNGIYIVRVIADSEVLTGKLIVK
jgi:hypothetical protein